MGYFDELSLEELMDRVRHEYDAATWNEQKVCSGGSFMYTPGPLMLMVDAFDSLEVYVPLVEARRVALPLLEGGRTAFVWLERCDGTVGHGTEVVAIRHEAWPRGQDYTGPVHYFSSEQRTERTFELAPAAVARAQHVAAHGQLALVILRGDVIEAAY